MERLKVIGKSVAVGSNVHVSTYLYGILILRALVPSQCHHPPPRNTVFKGHKALLRENDDEFLNKALFPSLDGYPWFSLTFPDSINVELGSPTFAVVPKCGAPFFSTKSPCGEHVYMFF